MRANLSCVAGAFVLLALTACSSPAPDAHPDLWVATESSGVSGAAIVAGNLTRNSEGCFGLSMSSGKPTGGVEFTTTQFPKGTTVLDDESGILLPNGKSVLLGGYIDGGGGYSSTDSPDDFGNFPATCPSDQVAFLESLF